MGDKVQQERFHSAREVETDMDKRKQKQDRNVDMANEIWVRIEIKQKQVIMQVLIWSKIIDCQIHLVHLLDLVD